MHIKGTFHNYNINQSHFEIEFMQITQITPIALDDIIYNFVNKSLSKSIHNILFRNIFKYGKIN